MARGSDVWERLGDYVNEFYQSMFPKYKAREAKFKLVSFPSGDILIENKTGDSRMGPVALSRAPRERVAHDKWLVAMYLGRFGIDGALFSTKISPFLFPY